MAEHRNALPPGYRIHWYVIREVLGQGGFGITYLAMDTNLNQVVAVKEYLPVEMAARGSDTSVHPRSPEHEEQFRWGLDRFISEARTLAQFKHANIVRVFTVFTENNTAYMIMEYEQGQALHEILKERGTLPEAELNGLLMPILDGLEQVHDRGFIHRDIKPANIFVRGDFSPVLLDFGSARQSLSVATRTLTTLVSPGFAPFEQYTGKSDKQGPWTDIYGLGATLYRLVIGRAPVDAMNRSEALLQTGRDVYVPLVELDPSGYSKRLLGAIDRAMAFRTEDRPQTIAEWRRDLQGPVMPTERSEAATEVARAKTAAPAVNDTVKITMIAGAVPDVAVTSDTRSRRSRLVAGSLAAVALLGVIGIALFQQPGREPVPEHIPGSVAVPAESSEAVPVTTSEPPPEMTQLLTEKTTAQDPIPGTAESQKSTAPPPANRPDSRMSESAPATPKLAAAAHPDQALLIGPRERERLAAIRRRLQQNPGDRDALQKLRAISNEFQIIVRQAIKERDYDRAEAYIDELLLLTPDNLRLKEAREVVIRARREGT
ncbi:MAG: protein kinase [Gammaproteobacteria bacterium]|nr:protein kinase [Gammaproteobacteria bacterium]